MTIAIEVTNVSKSFNDLPVLKDVTYPLIKAKPLGLLEETEVVNPCYLKSFVALQRQIKAL